MLVVSAFKLDAIDFSLKQKGAAVLELRLDLMSDTDIERLKSSSFNWPMSVLITIKPSKLCFKDILSICQNLKPAYCDIDHTLFEFYQPKLKNILKDTRFIVSKHTEAMYEIKKFFKKDYNNALKKLVIETNSTLDGLKIAHLAQKKHLILFASGKKNYFTRFFSSWHYCFLHDPTAEGQLCFYDLEKLYNNYFAIDKFYALIGSPLEHSLSHITHNKLLKDRYEGIYLKIDLNSPWLDYSLNCLKRLGAIGLSITTPLKKKIPLSFYKRSSPEKILNTLHLPNRSETNTDVLALIDLLKCTFVDRGLLLLGDGACAQAFASYLRSQNIEFDNFSRKRPIDLKKNYDVIINATSSPDPIVHLPNADSLINLYHHTPLPAIEIKASKQGTKVITGRQFFYTQAMHQFKFWIPHFKIISENDFFYLVN